MPLQRAQVMCVSVNDPYCMNAWKEKLGDKAKGIDFYGDADGSFTHFMVTSRLCTSWHVLYVKCCVL